MRRKESFDKLRMTSCEINTWLKRSLRYGRDDGFVEGICWMGLIGKVC